MKFIDNLPQLWKMWSVRIAAILMLIASTWDQIPDSVKSLIPQAWIPYIVAGVSLCIVIARAIKQFDNTDQPK
ncbi:hypothetical protein KVQ01_11235 [Escherichia coli]|uniref:DUF7940 domain-containing protein n=1 Tax=Escherichia coli TaxID=562 RepID=UPI001F0663D4|nr:hypothetical protein [Escherichia coli]MCH0685593.1 hypothetical protein [Escherichia coli]MDZ8667094.1 hypothetical protein [Escherichia coli]WRX87676.1 hypothetical protein SM938_22370 [Escherichia coli]